MAKIRDRLKQLDENIFNEVLKVEKEIEKYFPKINEIFREYTLHDKSHLDSLEKILDWLMPDEVIIQLNEYELFCLLCGVWAHDIGMGTSDDEIKNFCKSHEIQLPKTEEQVYFLREYHAALSEIIIINIIKKLESPTLASLAQLCGLLAHSHHFNSLDKIKNEYPVGIENKFIRAVYIAILIRLSDILHCTSERAPYVLMKMRNITNEISIMHWKTHQATVGIATKDNQITLHIACDDVKVLEWCENYFQLVKQEMEFCNNVLIQRNLSRDKLYLSANTVDRSIQAPFLDEVIKIKLETESAIRTLVGKNLYNDDSVVVRELMQNAIDACFLRQKREPALTPEVKIDYDSNNNCLTIEDNGIGLNIYHIKNNLLKSCSTGFRAQANKEDLISKFGIGFLTVFLVSDKVTVQTRHLDEAASSAFKIVLADTSTPADVRTFQKNSIGTKIILDLKKDIVLQEGDLIKWIPVDAKSKWVHFSLNGKKLQPEAYPTGEVLSPFEIKNIKFTKNSASFIIDLNALLLYEKGNCVDICGLSYQRVEDKIREFVLPPKFDRRIFNSGIPIINKSKSFPNYQTKDSRHPIFHKLFSSLELNIIKPGLVSLNLSRNDFITDKTNDDFFDAVDDALTDLVVEVHEFLKKNTSNPIIYSNNLIAEYWLSRLQRHCIPLIHNESTADKLAHVDKMWKIWEGSEWNFLAATGRPFQDSLNKYINSSDGVVFLPNATHKELEKNRLMTQVLQTMGKQLGKFSIVLGTLGNRYKQDRMTGLSSLALNMAFFDLTQFGLILPPLPIFYFQKNTNVKESTVYGATVFGNDNVLYNLSANPIFLGMSGFNHQAPLLNFNGDKAKVSEIEAIYKNVNRNQFLYQQNGRTTYSDHLKKLNIPEKYLNKTELSKTFQILFVDHGNNGALAVPQTWNG